MTTPGPWTAIILAAACFRIWRIISEDTILDRPRRWLVRLPASWQEGQAIPKQYRLKLAEFISCPWCCGFWIALGVWGMWQWQPKWTTVIAFPLALNAAAALIRVRLDPPED